MKCFQGTQDEQSEATLVTHCVIVRFLSSSIAATKTLSEFSVLMFQVRSLHWTNFTCSPGPQLPPFPEVHGRAVQESLFEAFRKLEGRTG